MTSNRPEVFHIPADFTAPLSGRAPRTPSTAFLSGHAQGIEAVVWDHQPGEGETAPAADHVLGLELRGARVMEARFEGGREQRVVSPPGGATFTPAGVGAVWRPHEPVRVLTVRLPDQLVRDALETAFEHERLADRRAARITELRSLLAEPHPTLERLGLDMLREIRRPSLRGGLYLGGLGHLLATEIVRVAARLRSSSGAATTKPQACPLSKEQQRRVLDYVDARLASELTISELAGVAFVSPFHFTRRFRATFGSSPWRFVVARRLDRAKHLLVAAPHRTISAVALDSGFASGSHLSVAFRQAMELTPREYRQIIGGSAAVARDTRD